MIVSINTHFGRKHCTRVHLSCWLTRNSWLLMVYSMYDKSLFESSAGESCFVIVNKFNGKRPIVLGPSVRGTTNEAGRSKLFLNREDSHLHCNNMRFKRRRLSHLHRNNICTLQPGHKTCTLACKGNFTRIVVLQYPHQTWG